MLGADRLGVAEGREVELLIPIEQLALIGDERHDLSTREVNMEELAGAASKGVH